MKDIKTYIKDTSKINPKKPITTENSENRNDKRIINEGLFSSGCPGWFNDLFAPFKSFFFDDKGKEKDDRTEYQKTLDNARASKLEQIKNQRNALKSQKDKLKAEAVNVKSEFEKNHLKLAHEHQMAQIQAQIDMLKDQKNRWKENKSRLTREEYEYGLHQYEKQIADVQNTEEKSDEEKKKELLLNLVYEYNQETGELEYIGNDTEKIKKALDNNPDLKNELEKAYAGNNEALDELSPENIKDLAENMANSTEEAIKQNDNYIATEKTAVQEGERALSEIASISEKRIADTSKNEEEIGKIDANINQKKKLLGLDMGTVDGNNLQDLLAGFTPSDSDKDEDKKAAAKTHMVKELKKMGIDISDDDIPDSLISISDGKVEIPTNLSGDDTNTAAKDFIGKINDKKDEKINSINTFLEENKDKAKGLGYTEEQIESAKNADNTDMKVPDKPKPKAQDYTKEERESIASVLGYTKDGEKWKDKDGNEVNLAEKIKDPESLGDMVKAKKEELENKKEAIKKAEEEKEKRSSEIKTQVKDAKAAFAERENQRADAKFTKEVDAAKNDYIPGTTKNDKGKIGYYDGEEFKERPSKDDPDFKEKMKEWEKGRVKAILDPSKKQKEMLNTGDTVKIKIKKEGDDVKYYKVDINGDPTECSRDEALETEKKLMAKKETDTAKKAVKTAFDKGKPYDGVEKNDVESETNTSEDNSFEDEDGNTYKKEGDKYIMTDEDGEEIEIDKEDFEKAKEKAVDDEKEGDERTDNDDDLEDDEVDDKGNSKKDPRKIYKRRSYKRGNKTFKSKSYYDKKGNSISAKEFKEKVANFEKSKKQKDENFNISNFLKDKLIVERFYPRDITNYLKEHLR